MKISTFFETTGMIFAATRPDGMGTRQLGKPPSVGRISWEAINCPNWSTFKLAPQIIDGYLPTDRFPNWSISQRIAPNWRVSANWSLSQIIDLLSDRLRDRLGTIINLARGYAGLTEIQNPWFFIVKFFKNTTDIPWLWLLKSSGNSNFF